jgi:hypothetical protein
VNLGVRGRLRCRDPITVFKPAVSEDLTNGGQERCRPRVVFLLTAQSRKIAGDRMSSSGAPCQMTDAMFGSEESNPGRSRCTLHVGFLEETHRHGIISTQRCECVSAASGWADASRSVGATLLNDDAVIAYVKGERRARTRAIAASDRGRDRRAARLDRRRDRQRVRERDSTNVRAKPVHFVLKSGTNTVLSCLHTMVFFFHR